VATMRQAHLSYLEDTRRLRLPYKPGTRGIVSTAGGAYMSIFLISLHMLRRTNCTLPVELVLDSKTDDNIHLCEKVLSELNAHCIYLTDVLGPKTQELSKFQLKVFSILSSSFESVLFLDADNYPINDPTSLFNTASFTKTGLVTWPDFWTPSSSKHFYEIQSPERPPPALNTRPSTESGQLLVSKRTHAHALLTAAYYNFYGPGFYYPLLSQGASGQGDKETFLAGAEAVDAEYAQVRDRVDTVGYYEQGEEDKKGAYHGVAMLQYFPREEVAVAENEGTEQAPVPLFVHQNYPKMNLEVLFAEDGAVRDSKGGFRRLLGTKEVAVERFGRDVETEVWEEVEEVACGYLEERRRAGEEGGGQGEDMCGMVRSYRNAVFG